MLPAFEARDGKTVNNPTEANIIAEVRSPSEIFSRNAWVVDVTNL